MPEAARERRLWNDEVKALLDALDKQTNQDIRDFVLLALVTGARKSNILSMRWDDVLPLERAIWRIPDTKNGLPHDLPLVDEAVGILSARLARKKSEFVFPGSGRTGHLVEPKAAWAEVLKQAGIKNFRIHDLRRTQGSYQADAGIAIETIGQTLAHKSPITTRIYARIAMDPRRQALEAGTAGIMKAAGRAKHHGEVEPFAPDQPGAPTAAPT